jgi:hypothetical protein
MTRKLFASLAAAAALLAAAGTTAPTAQARSCAHSRHARSSCARDSGRAASCHHRVHSTHGRACSPLGRLGRAWGIQGPRARETRTPNAQTHSNPTRGNLAAGTGTVNTPTAGASPSSPSSGASDSALGLFAPTSVWNAPLSSNAPLDPTSGARIAALTEHIQNEVQAGTGPWMATSSYSTPLYVVSASQPQVPVTLDGAAGWGDSLQAALNQGVPIPSNAHPASGTDGQMTVYQPATDTLWEFWRASHRSDGWHASWGGAMRNVSQSPGYYTDHVWAGLSSSQGYNWGSTASSLPVVAGVIRMDELRLGQIHHALAVAVPDACSGRFAWPAQRTDGGSADASCIPEGAHLRLDPSLNLAALNLPPITLELAQAAQRYGLIVRDVTHNAFQFYAEDPTPTGTDPYYSANGLFDGLPPWKFLPQFPWSHLQLLKMLLCTSAPCG